MMLNSLPNTLPELLKWTWQDIAPHFNELANRPLNAQNVNEWLADWTALDERIG